MKLFHIIQEPSSLYVVDSSKLDTYLRCPRKYFFEHVLGWRPTYPSNHLVFGQAWHYGVEHLTRSNYSKESLTEAQFLFEAHYQTFFSEEDDEMFGPKTCLTGMRGLKDYYSTYRDRDTQEFQTLHTECGGVVLISKDQMLHFRMDWIGSSLEDGKIYGRDYKTSQSKHKNWDRNYQLSNQILLYYHILHCLYGLEKVEEMSVRQAFFYSNKKQGDFREFYDVRISKTRENMQAWLEDISLWFYRLIDDIELLKEQDSTDEICMKSFPRNPTSCGDFYGCPHLSYCSSWSNPLDHVNEIPLDMHVEYWDPRTLPVRETLKITS